MGVLNGFIKPKAKKSFVLRDLMNDPEKFELNMYFEHDEIVVKIRKRKINLPEQETNPEEGNEES